jgi:hypothetical protein
MLFCILRIFSGILLTVRDVFLMQMIEVQAWIKYILYMILRMHF